jgi:hypothetical protein
MSPLKRASVSRLTYRPCTRRDGIPHPGHLAGSDWQAACNVTVPAVRLTDSTTTSAKCGSNHPKPPEPHIRYMPSSGGRRQADHVLDWPGPADTGHPSPDGRYRHLARHRRLSTCHPPPEADDPSPVGGTVDFSETRGAPGSSHELVLGGATKLADDRGDRVPRQCGISLFRCLSVAMGKVRSDSGRGMLSRIAHRRAARQRRRRRGEVPPAAGGADQLVRAG